MIRTRCAERRETWTVVTVHKPQHLLVVLHRRYETLVNGNLPAEEWQYLRLQAPAFRLRQRLILLSAERLCASVMRFNVTRRTIDYLERRLVTRPIVVVPRAHPVMTQQNPLRLRVLLNQLFDLQTNIETRPLPRRVDHLVAINFLRQLLLVDGSGNRDHGVGVQMVDVLEGHERMQRRIDRTGARVEIEDAVAVHRIHDVFNRSLRPAFRTA